MFKNKKSMWKDYKIHLELKNSIEQLQINSNYLYLKFLIPMNNETIKELNK